MSELVQGWTSLPNLHPLAVHLPIALLPLAVAVDLVAAARPRAVWLDRTATLLYVVGAAGAGLAVWLGERAAESFVGLPPRLQPRIGEHSDWGHWVWYLFGALALMRLALCWRDRDRDRLSMRGARLLVAVAALGGLAVVARAADLGGALVYRHGLGVAAVEEARKAVEEGAEAGAAASTARSAATEGDATARLTVDESGVVEWRPAPRDGTALGEVVEAVHGTSLEALSAAETGSAANGLIVAVDGPAVLALADDLGDVQVDAELELLDFEGSVGVGHHLGREERGGFFLLATDGTVRLIDRRGGDERVLDEGEVAVPAAPFVLAVSSAGRHLKGLLDGETVTHGHVDAPPPGACGLVLDGRGTVRIVRVVVTPLDDR
ncbi:MAG: DUF2231 domain-containing protein [Thermoanaerobaculia bacterium]|nr:DUF2231 domain-containing protein [Thermoanaerobaculia bacterium]